MEIVRWGMAVTVILILRKVTWGRITRRMQYGIWIAMMLLFIFQPFFSIQSRFSIWNFFYERETMLEQKETIKINSKQTMIPIIASTQDEMIRQIEADRREIAEQNERQSFRQELFQNIKESKNSGKDDGINYLRWSVTALFCIWLFLSNLHFYRFCLKNRVFYKQDKETGLKIYLLRDLASPFLLGNHIYVDTEMSQNEQRLRYMILHEYCHYRQGDFLWVFLRNISLALYFYNPFIWIVVRYMKRDCELACDEAVINKLCNDAECSEYGYTLLALAGKQNLKAGKLTVTTSMSSDAKRLKERIVMITSKRKNNIIVSIVAALSVCCLVGCIFTERIQTQRIEKMEIGENKENLLNVATNQKSLTLQNNLKEKQNTMEQSFDNINVEDTIYNSVKWTSGYFYFSDSDGLKRISEETLKVQKLADGNVKLGNFHRGFLYYIRYPEEEEHLTGIMRINVKNLSEQQLVEWSEEMWTCSNLFVCEEGIYLELADSCKAYEQNGDIVEIIPETQQIVYQVLERCGYTKEDVAVFPPGYVNILFQNHRLVYRDLDNNKLLIYDSDSGNLDSEIMNAQSDVLLSNQGVVYKSLSGDIYLQSWNGNQAELLYQVENHNNEIINYGTYDDEYIYGFVEEGKNSTLIKISWKGEYERGKTFEEVEKAVQLGLSANHGIVSYWQDGQIFFEKS